MRKATEQFFTLTGDETMSELAFHVLRVPKDVKEVQLTYVLRDKHGSQKKEGACNSGTILEVSAEDVLTITVGELKQYTSEDVAASCNVEEPKGMGPSAQISAASAE